MARAPLSSWRRSGSRQQHQRECIPGFLTTRAQGRRLLHNADACATPTEPVSEVLLSRRLVGWWTCGSPRHCFGLAVRSPSQMFACCVPVSQAAAAADSSVSALLACGGVAWRLRSSCSRAWRKVTVGAPAVPLTAYHSVLLACRKHRHRGAADVLRRMGDQVDTAAYNEVRTCCAW